MKVNIDVRYFHGKDEGDLSLRDRLLQGLVGLTFRDCGAAGVPSLEIKIESVISSGEDVHVALDKVRPPEGAGRMKLILIHRSQFDEKEKADKESASKALNLDRVYLVFVGGAGLEVAGFSGHPRVSRLIDLFLGPNGPNDRSQLREKLLQHCGEILRMDVNGQ